MRMWHYRLIPYLPDLQLKGQLRELVAIMHDWRDRGQTNHLLINHIMDYPRFVLYLYFKEYDYYYRKRFGKFISEKYEKEFLEFGLSNKDELPCFIFTYDWQDKVYLRICMANLYEKYLGKGKTKLTDNEWNRLKQGYKQITGEDYVI